MEPMIAKCGIRCDLCPCYEFNLISDEDKVEVCGAFAEYYGYQLTPEQLNPCKGCSQLDRPPDSRCQIFFCVQKKNIANCAHCQKYPCDMLKTNMEEGEKELNKLNDLPPEKYEKYCRPYLTRETLEKIRESLES